MAVETAVQPCVWIKGFQPSSRARLAFRASPCLPRFTQKGDRRDLFVESSSAWNFVAANPKKTPASVVA